MSVVTRGRQCLCVAGLLLQCLIILKCSAITVTITTPIRENEYNNNINSTSTELTTLRGIGRTIAHCLVATEQWKCFEEQLNRYIDVAAQSNSTWQLGDYIFIEPVAGSKSEGHVKEQATSQRVQHQRSLLTQDIHAHAEQGIVGSLLQLAKSRSIRFKLPSSKHTLNKIGAGISDVIDGLALENIAMDATATTEAAQADEGTVRILNGLVDDKLEKVVDKLTVLNGTTVDETIYLQNDQDKRKITNKFKYEKIKHTIKNKYKDKEKDKDKDKNKKKKDKAKDKHKSKYKKKKKIKEGLLLYETSLKARKKKGKDKNMAMMGGMAMVAMIAQMFLGKVILIAGAAFVMAKIALVVSVLGSLKKGSIGSSGSTTERIVVTGQTHGSTSSGGHGGHSYETGWHRSMPHLYAGTEVISEPGASHQNQGYYIKEINEETDNGFRRRQANGKFLL